MNPLQFGPHEDYARYPRPFRADKELCQAAYADVLFRPSPEGLYPDGFRTKVGGSLSADRSDAGSRT